MSNTSKKNTVGGAIISLTALLCAAAFLFIGFTQHIWHPTWLIFLSIPIVSAIVDIATKRDASGSISGIVAIICVIIFFYLGTQGYWHPGWLVFFAIPITHTLISIFKRSKAEKTAENADTDKKQDS